MKHPSIIAIDGPAASGKSTLGRRLAESLGYLFFDTGVMYRAITWAMLDQEVDVKDENAVTKLAENTRIDVCPASKEDGRSCDVLVDGQEITWEIRTPKVEQFVSPVSAYQGVRRALASQQRRIGLRGHVVMVGRDIGTVVLPEAELKVYLDASAEIRAKRRYAEIIERGGHADYEQILKGVQLRDEIDSTRAFSPLRVAEDAIRIDSEHMDADEVFLKVEELCRQNSIN
jgi:cytidylate kinase